MSILSSIRDFGSNVVSGIGNVFHSSPSPSVFNAPNSTIYGPQQPSPVYQSISDSVFSSIARWIAPDDQPVAAGTHSQPQVLYVSQGGATTTGATSGGKIFGIPQVTLLVVLGGVAAFLILKRN
jgi:hypothetical protein